jgi:hypothetical protein
VALANGKGDRYRPVPKDYGERYDKIFKRRDLVLMSCECARLSLEYVEYGRTQPIDAIETAEAWVRGEATIEEVRAAATKSAHLAVHVAYSAYSATPYSAFNAAKTVYTDDPLDSAQRAIDSTCFANRKKTLRKCEKIAKKYRIRIDYEPIRLRRM